MWSKDEHSFPGTTPNPTSSDPEQMAADRVQRINSSQEQLLQAQLQQLGIGTTDSMLDSLHNPSAYQTPFLAADASPLRNIPQGSAQWNMPMNGLSSNTPWNPTPMPPLQHRRGASDVNAAFRFPSSQPAYQRADDLPPRTSSPSYTSGMEQQRQALQQQIDQLQLQQEQLLRQQNFVSLLPSVHEYASPPRGAHRRIQSHSATTGLGAFDLLSQRSAYADARSGWNAAPGMVPFAESTSRSNFSFPPRRTTSESVGARHGAVGSEVPPRGHTRHASYQLASELSPEYLIAGGGMLHLATMGTNNEFSDDSFTESPAKHNRSSSMSSALLSWRPGTPNADPLQNLSQAQAQLAALHRSRQQAGPGTHSRSASYSGGRTPSQGQVRKALFGSYLPQASLPPLLLTGKLVVGILRVNKRNRSDAWVTTEVLEHDIFISGSKDRNRALEGDLVAVELLDPQEVWQTKRDKVDKKKRKEESQADCAPDSRRMEKVRDDIEVEGALLGLVADEEESENSPPALAGHVVAIVERTPGQIFPGTLALLRPSSAATKEKQQTERHADEKEPEKASRPKIIWFRPSDKRVPLIAIPADQAPPDFWDESPAFNTCLFVAGIKRWPITSLHPFGAMVDRLGQIGTLEAEFEALLRTHCNALASAFSEAALKSIAQCKVPAHEYADRASFGPTQGSPTSKAAVFSLQDNRLQDTAFSVEIRDDAFCVGVHIADVCAHVRPGSALDREAKKRGETVDLVHKAYDMLPPALGERVGLHPGKDRLAYSVVFTLANDDAEVWIGKSVVHVQERLTEAALDARTSPPFQQLKQYTSRLRAERIAQGALLHTRPHLAFALDKHGSPTAVHVVQHSTHELILRANRAIAFRIAAALPNAALLLRQDAPQGRAMDALCSQLRALGIQEAVSTATLPSIIASLDAPARNVADALLANAMDAPKFYCTGMVDIAKFAHYTLPAPLYTQCCAPLHSYADLCVQRQLETVLQNATQDAESVAKIAQQSNSKHQATLAAKAQCEHLYLCQLICTWSAMHGLLRRTATVMAVSKTFFDILIPDLGVEKRIYLDCLPLETYTYDAPRSCLYLTWRRGIHSLQYFSTSVHDAHIAQLWATLQDSVQTAPHEGETLQHIRPLAQLEVYIAAELEKSPPILKVFAENPFAR
ncbi:Translational repressor [Malassezia vespertilionis]|nr:Translational repressor [Malassezia vespertilionis]WFD05876.1 Translational repressor [Malassezia vespertilionis]